MADNEITGFISSEAFKQFDELNKQADTFASKLVDLNAQLKQTSDTIAGAKGFGELNKATQQANQQTALFVSNSKLYTQTMEQAASVLSIYNGKSREFTAVQKDLAQATLTEAKAQTENSKQTLLAQKYIELLTKAKEKNEAQAARLTKQVQQQQSAYYQLSKQYRDAAQRAKDLAAAHGVGSAAAKDAQEKALALNNQLKEIDASIGSYQRSVGDYKQATLSLSQLIREAPAFANSMQTGLSAIGNNIPMLIEEFGRLKESVGSTKEALAIMGKSLFSTVNVVVLAFTAIQFIQAGALDGIFKTKEAVKQLTPEMQKFTDTVNESTKNVFESAAQEQTKMSVLLAIAKDASVAMSARKEAIKELQDTYPAYLGSLKQEQFLYGETADAVNKLNEALMAKALFESASKRAAASADLILTYKDQIRELDKLKETNQKTLTELNKSTDDWEIIANKRKQISFLEAADPKVRASIEKNIKDAQDKQRQYFADAAEYAKQAAGLIVPPKDEVAKKAKDLTNELLKSTEDRVNQEVKLYQQARERYAESQKLIHEDTTKTLDERLNAYKAYQQALFDIQDSGHSAEYTNTLNTLNKIRQIEQKSLKDRTDEEKTLLLKKSELQIKLQTIEGDAAKNRRANEEQTAQGIKAIWDNEVSDRLQGLQTINATIAGQEREALSVLQQEYEKGNMTYQRYQAEKALIQTKYAKLGAAEEIKYLQSTIQALQAKGVDITKLQEALNESLNGLYQQDQKNFEEAQQKKQQAAQQLLQLTTSLVSTGVELYKQSYQSDLDALDVRKQALDAQYSAEQKQIQDSTASEKEKTDKLAELNARKLEDERKLDREKAKIARNKAIADRVNALFQVSINTAQSLAAATTYLSNPVTAPLYPFIQGLIAAVGFAQAAAVVAAPIPAYAEGVLSHPGGLALFGEAGAEFVKEPGKPGYIADTPTLRNLAAGASVTPIDKLTTDDLIRMQLAGDLPTLLAYAAQKQDSELASSIKGLQKSVDKLGDTPKVEIGFDGETFTKTIHRNGSRTTYLNRRLNL